MTVKPLIIEGPDGAGKSTLIEKLVDEFNLDRAPKFSRSLEGPNGGFIHQAQMDMAQVESMQGFIYDRHPAISEPIYGPIIRRSDAYYALLPQFPRWKAAVNLVICLPPWNVATQNLGHNPQLAGVEEHYPLIYSAYEHFLTITPPSFCTLYDYTLPGSYNQVRRLVNG